MNASRRKSPQRNKDVTGTTKCSKKQRFKNLGEDAQILGVTRSHLWMVLTGKRESARLSKAYKALQTARKKIEDELNAFDPYSQEGAK